MAGAKAVGFLDLDASGFNTAIKAATGALVALGAAFASYKVADFFVQGVKEAINFGNEMGRVAARLGHMDPGKLLIMQKALENSGMAAGDTAGAVAKLVESGKPFSSYFLNAGGAGSALGKATKDYGAQADALSKSSRQLMSLWNDIQSISGKVKAMFSTMTAEFIGPLRAAIGYLNDTLSLTDFGTRLGKTINSAVMILVGGFTNNTLFEILALRMKLAFEDAWNWLSKQFESIKEFFNNEQAQQMFSGLGEIFSGLGKILKSYLVSGAIEAANLIAGKATHEVWQKKQRALANTIGTDAFREKKDLQNTQRAINQGQTAEGQASFKKQGYTPEQIEVINNQAEKRFESIAMRLRLITGNVDFDYRRKNDPNYRASISADTSVERKEGIDQIAEATKKMGKSGEDFSAAIAALTGDSTREEDTSRLSKLEKEAKDSADAILAKYTGKDQINPLNYSALESSGGFSTISSSMAKIGGGGGYIQNTLSAEAKEMQKMNRAANLQLEVQKEIAVNTLPKNQYLKLAD